MNWIILSVLIVGSIVGGYLISEKNAHTVYVDVPGPTVYVDVPGPVKIVKVPGPTRVVTKVEHRHCPSIANALNEYEATR